MTEPTKAEILRCADKILKGHTHGFYDVAGTKLCMMDTEEWESLMALRVKMYEEPPANPDHDMMINGIKNERRILIFVHKVGCDGNSQQDGNFVFCIKCHNRVNFKTELEAKPAAGWPTVRDIVHILWNGKIKTKFVYNGRKDEYKSVTYREFRPYAEAIHAAFTKAFKERGIE